LPSESCYISNNLALYLDSVGMDHVRGAPNHPPTQGKIESYHSSMKNVIKLENYYCPEELIYRLDEFVVYYNNNRYHESLQNVTPADVYFGRDKKILKNRTLTKQKTMKERRILRFLNSKMYDLTLLYIIPLCEDLYSFKKNHQDLRFIEIVKKIGLWK